MSGTTFVAPDQPEEGVAFLGTEVTGGCRLALGCQELDQSPLEEQPGLLPAEPFNSSPCFIDSNFKITPELFPSLLSVQDLIKINPKSFGPAL